MGKNEDTIYEIGDRKKNNKTQQICLAGLAAVVVLVIILGVAVFKINPVWVCVLVLLEAVFVALIGSVPMWVHGLACLVQLTVGFIISNPVFVVCLIAVYVAAVAFIYFFNFTLGIKK